MKLFSKYLIPSLISTVLFSSFALIDGIFIGQKIGDLGLAAINIAWPITALIQALGQAIGLSSGIYISRLEGKNEHERSEKIRLTAIIIILALSIILGAILYFGSRNILIMLKASGTTLDYAVDYIHIILMGAPFQMLGCGLIPLLKNSDMVKTAFYLSIISMLTNLSLDYLFIMVCNMMLKGAALASIIGQAIPVVVGLVLFRHKLKGYTIDGDDLKEIALGSIAPFALIYSYSFIILVTNLFCIKYGGDEAVACYSLLSYLLYIAQAIATATGDAIQPLFSYNLELKRYKKNKIYLFSCLFISFTLNTCFSILVILFKNNIAVLYNLSEGTKILYFDAILYFIYGFIMLSQYKVICSYMYSTNEKLLSNILVLIEPLLVTPLVYLILTRFYGIKGIWISFGFIQGLLLFIAIALKSYSERKSLIYGWIHFTRQA